MMPMLKHLDIIAGFGKPQQNYSTVQWLVYDRVLRTLKVANLDQTEYWAHRHEVRDKNVCR